MANDLLDSLCVGIDLLLVGLNSDQFGVDPEFVVLHLLQEFVDPFLLLVSLLPLLDLNGNDLLLQQVELALLLALDFDRVHSFLKQGKSLAKLLVDFLQLHNQLSVALVLLEDWVDKLAHHLPHLGFEVD